MKLNKVLLYIPIKYISYSTLNEHGFIHKTVNHSENFTNPKTSAETQTIETPWRHVQNKNMWSD